MLNLMRAWLLNVWHSIEVAEKKKPLTEHDLRAKVASDAKSLEHAMQLLSHADPRTTQKTYRRKAVVVTPMQ